MASLPEVGARIVVKGGDQAAAEVQKLTKAFDNAKGHMQAAGSAFEGGDMRNSDDEIEVTSEMVEAGFKVLCDSGIADEYLEADKWLVAEIFRAMSERHRQKGHQRQLR
jgi:hypothetical protein